MSKKYQIIIPIIISDYERGKEDEETIRFDIEAKNYFEARDKISEIFDQLLSNIKKED